ncbi:MAG: shikimate kinase [Clostridia bacterium]|nr:shikimate kinase [Clostridia bacterium]
MNVTLIGMPGAGKSTVGVLLAKSMLMDFVDTDLLIQRKYGMSLCEFIEKYGEEEFKRAENDVISSLNCENTVIATGGSAVYSEGGMKHLCKISTIVYLSVPVESLSERLSNIRTRGVVMKKGESIEQLFQRRSPLYEKYAEITVDCSALRAEECVDEIIGKLNG